MKHLTLLLFVLFLAAPVRAQEVNCTVTISTELLTAEARENLQEFADQLQYYVNSYRWTEEDLAPEKISCTFNISFQGSPRQNRYTAQVFVGSQRRIHNSESNTALMRVLDDKWEFEYVRGQQIIHDETVFDPLVSFMDFYVYTIIGLDFESYQPGAGVPYLQKAMNVVNTARAGGKGWELVSPNTYSRGQLVDEWLSAKFQGLREALYRYHYVGLDYLSDDEAKAKQNILVALEQIGQIQSEINQPSQAIRIFFDTKYLEIAETFRNYDDLGVYDRLIEIDPAHSQTYNDMREKSN
jgi:hypothetical protein